MLQLSDEAIYFLDNYGHCDRSDGKTNNCYWGKDEFGNWNGCLRTGWRGRQCIHWHPADLQPTN